MLHRIITSLTITTGLMIGSLPQPVVAADLIRCESSEKRYEYCRTDTHGGVKLERQLSDKSCVYKRTWGYDRGGVWVDNGCRAIFRVGSNNRNNRNRDVRPAARNITCRSDDYNYRYCPANTHGGVKVRQQLSSSRCDYNRSWGYDRGGIWVDKGCGAEFVLGRGHTRNDNRNDYGYGRYDDNDDSTAAAIVGGAIALGVIAAGLASQDSSNEGTIITCGSNDRDFHRCPVDTRRGVSLRRQLSREGCWQSSTWGYDEEGIWVDQGCRAEFLVR